MRIYRVVAANSDHQSLVPAYDRVARDDPRLAVRPTIPDGWTPPPLVNLPGKKKVDADFWDYGQGLAFAISDRVAEKLAQEPWCKLVPFVAESLDSRLKPKGEVRRTLLAVVRVADALDREGTKFKPYGVDALDFDQAGAVVFHEDRLPLDGLFLQASGSSFEILATDSFARRYEAEGWTGLRFVPV